MRFMGDKLALEQDFVGVRPANPHSTIVPDSSVITL
jgi:hypothetical protein